MQSLRNPNTDANTVTDAAGLVSSEEESRLWVATQTLLTGQPYSPAYAILGSQRCCEGPWPSQPPSHHDCKYLPQNTCPNLLRVSVGLKSLPAEGSEPGQVIGVVDIVANSDNLMETLNLNTHHLQDTKELEHLSTPQFL